MSGQADQIKQSGADQRKNRGAAQIGSEQRGSGWGDYNIEGSYLIRETGDKILRGQGERDAERVFELEREY